MISTSACVLVLALSATSAAPEPPLVRSAASGAWSDAKIWEGGAVPAAGSRVQIREGHAVVYDVSDDRVIRSIHVAGTLDFARDRDTKLTVGLIKIQAGDDPSENGFDCEAHPPAAVEPGAPRPTLRVGTAEEPIPAGKTALIRLAYVEGMDKETCPAIVDCGGRMEFHGAAIAKTWTKLAREAYRNEPIILVPYAAVEGWKPGDQLVVTGTTHQFGYKDTRTHSVAERPATETRRIVKINKYNELETPLARIILDKPLEGDHRAQDQYRAEVANLSRNVVIESADPDGVRGHTMYHRNSTGSVSYTEFRHLGKEGVLGKYSLHFHLAGETMRGASVVGASFWDSKNRWITIHGTSYLVVRDCVGYKSVGHGFFLEDGTETRNILDGNLAIMALRGKPLPDQMLPYDQNLGSGFWWANSLNAFTNNVAAECDQDGYRFEVFAGDGFDPVRAVLQPDGGRKPVDIRTLPFIRFDDNEAHCMRFFGMNLGGFNDGGVPAYPGEKQVSNATGNSTANYAGTEKKKNVDVEGIGPDSKHPFLIRRFRAWDTHWAFHGGSPSVRVDGMDLYDSQYGIWRTVIDGHEYSDLKMDRIISRQIFFPRPGNAKTEGIAFLNPVDDLPPSTVITDVRLKDKLDPSGPLIVRGSTCDDYGVLKVVVNNRQANALRPNFAEWEVELVAPANGWIEASAQDSTGNFERTPHRVHVP
ncbi:G8 domain-containing protein [Paludisphaera rhizosphaerae]|uniref:G8 domain-containing protein n=1 Tax=Paludisphaera rhizosphaerae TaxID=2711216 RepID=UPI0013EB7F0C|nr:G8 domain-containing protein [Paludisphaera rhizosphaerae]